MKPILQLLIEKLEKISKSKVILIEKESSKLGLKKHEWEKINIKSHPELVDEFLELINIAYSQIGGHSNIKSTNDILSNDDFSYVEVVDIDQDPDIDVLYFGKNTKHGIKLVGVGHDGARASIISYFERAANKVKNQGFYCEVDNRIMKVLERYNVPIINNQQEVEQVLGKKVTWVGENPKGSNIKEGWYLRDIAGEKHYKILVGKPN